MKLTLKNFGGFGDSYVTELFRDTTVVRPNQSGKTTIVNAYVFAISGKTLGGFEARHVYADPDDVTEVILEGLIDQPIRRVLSLSGGTTLYVGGNVKTQKEFAEMFDVDLAVACANVNVLTEASLTTEQLRKLLISANLIDGDESAELRKEQKRVREARRQAEGYAAASIAVPARTCEPLTLAETRLKEEFERSSALLTRGVDTTCRTCKRPLPAKIVEERQHEYDTAEEYVRMYRDEYTRILQRVAEYEREDVAIRDAERLVERARQARADVQTYTIKLAELDEKLRELDERAMANAKALPEGVAIVTEQITKTGKLTPVCTLTYNGVPLKSVNRGRRIRLCIELLDRARATKGQQRIPILVDNAESVQGIEEAFDNVIQFKVG
jgi:DNA repair exonuclease SbcCD ATPase subunit